MLIYYVVTARIFALYSKELGEKARDLQPNNRYGIRYTVIMNSMIISYYEIVCMQNEQFKARGMSNRVGSPHVITQEPVGPVRICSIFNEDTKRNEERVETEIYHLNSEPRVIEKVTKHTSVFTRGDFVRAVKYIPAIMTLEKDL